MMEEDIMEAEAAIADVYDVVDSEIKDALGKLLNCIKNTRTMIERSRR